MARLCDICATISWPELLEPYGIRRHTLTWLIVYASLTNFPCPLCKLIWWSLRSDHRKIESEITDEIPVWLWRSLGEGNRITVVTGAALLDDESVAQMKFDFIDYLYRIAKSRSIAVGTLCLYSIRGMGGPHLSLFSHSWPGGSAPLAFNQMVIESDPSSDRALEMVQRQVSACIDDRAGHFECFRSDRSEHPKRIIDLKAEDDSNLLRLQDVAESGLDKQRLDYIALSYCWGEEERFVTSSTNLLANKTRFSLNKLPPTIQDAVTITRKLNIRYLWVDALCIIQGNDEAARNDWAAESERMAAIYGNAVLTISAASAKTAFEGFLRPREDASSPSSVTLPQSFPFNPSGQHLVLSPQRSLTPEKLEPLSRRAWALQEKILSQRNLIYGASEIIFVCKKSEWRESGHTERYCQQLHDWQATMTDYSARAMTDSWDRLPAIQGLADYFKHTQGIEIFQGIRPQCIARDLLWQHVDSTSLRLSKPTIDRAASWSWAAVDGPVRFYKPDDYYAPIVDLRCEWTKLEEGKTTLKRAVLRGSGELVHVSSIKWQARAVYDHHADVCCPLAFIGSWVRTFLDCPSTHKHDVVDTVRHSWKELRDVWFLFLFGTAGLILKAVPEMARQRRSLGVLLSRRVTKITTFKRIGMFTTKAEDIRGERIHLEDLTIY
jgi:Heterokaryon incompatibility protein (HET)